MKRSPDSGSDTGPDLDTVREELRRLGYLSHRLDRFLLQDALRPRGALGAWLRLAGKVGLVAGGGLALFGAFGLALANGSLVVAPFDSLLLFLHLLLPLVLLAVALFLPLAGALALALRTLPVRRFESVPAALAAAVAGGLAGVALWQEWGALLALPRALAAVVLAIGLAAVAGLWALLDRGLLGLAIGLTRNAPGGRSFSAKRMGAGGALIALALALPVLWGARSQRPVETPPLPESPGDRVLLLAVDGALAAEIDYLLARGELPELGRLAREGLYRPYPREPEAPATFWTNVATGVGAERHGVVALEAVEPLGVAVPLARLGLTRAIWKLWSEPIGLAAERPLLSSRRRAPALWELAARGGSPVAVVNWWATFPAEPLPGLLLAHGAFQLLAEEAAGAVAPAARSSELADLASSSAASSRSLAALTELPAALRARLEQIALRPDAFYRLALERELGRAPRVAALYLPALDIAFEEWTGGELAFADLLRSELAELDRLLALSSGFQTIAVLIDPGRRAAGGEGRLVLWRKGGCESSGRSPIPPEQIASGLLRALGLPQSGELGEPPAGCAWPEPAARVPSYGERAGAGASAAAGEEYLRNLRSLGYL